MAIKISGILKDGMGRPIPKCTIELLCKKTSLTVVVETEARIGLDNTGSYNMQVEPGKYDVSLYIVGFPPKRAGEIQVYLDSLPGTLNDFLTMPGESDLTPELVAIFQQLRNETQQAASEAKADKELADSILTDVITVQTDVNEKQQQVNADAIDAGKSKTASAASAKAAAEDAVRTAADVATVAGLTANAETAASSAVTSNNSAIESAGKAESAAVSAEDSKVSTSVDASRAEAARTASEGIQTDLTQKYDQVVSDTAAVLEAKTAAVNAATSAASDSQATAQDRSAVSADKQTVGNDKAQSQASAATATENAGIAVTEANRATAEADRAVAAMNGKQDKSQLLTSMSGLTTAANQLIYSNGVNTVTTTPFTQLARNIVGKTTSREVLTELGLTGMDDFAGAIESVNKENNNIVTKGGINANGFNIRNSSGGYSTFGMYHVAGSHVEWTATCGLSGKSAYFLQRSSDGAIVIRGEGTDNICTHYPSGNITGPAWAGWDLRGELNAHGISDKNHKVFIKPTEVNPMDYINQMEFVQFGWKYEIFPYKDTANVSLGVIAQDLQKIDSALVVTRPDGSLGVDTLQALAVALAAIKQLNERVTELESRSLANDS